MAAEDMGMVPPAHLLFQDSNNSGNNHLRFSSGPPQHGEPGPKTTRELSSFIDDHRYFHHQPPEFRRSIFSAAVPHRQDHRGGQNWSGNGNGRSSTTPSGDGSDIDDEEDDDDDEEEENDVNGLVDSSNKNNSSNTSGNSSAAAAGKMGSGHMKHFSSFGSSRDVMMKEDHIGSSENGNSNLGANSGDNQQQERVSDGQYNHAMTIADVEGELYYTQLLQGPAGSPARQKDVGVENGCGFSGRKDVSYASESGDSLRAILADPLTGALMEDAVILPCGHSFGGGGMQHVIRMVRYEKHYSHFIVSIFWFSTFVALRAAVQAFRREEELQVCRASKKRRERFEQDKNNYGDTTLMDHPRGRGVQFPFSVTDRVIIKGNKRTPERFVGREAVVTTQCLNGWYVVKTLDNAESVKLQYRSLAKVSDNPTSKPVSGKMTPNWL
ncbi:hypothetical protein RJ640_026253 [Escallonia rubra]|uniref:PUB 62/63 C-terminal domain-containing protein n=1 Tax=Escallonia rubra TaxID=112253 RepID=A0AA88UFB0_9ASTE|nr:hypothetical protein RJ640_026253 [Escallonia rubra]